jgi:hypothetical protein
MFDDRPVWFETTVRTSRGSGEFRALTASVDSDFVALLSLSIDRMF